jgi:hypothetical protein
MPLADGGMVAGMQHTKRADEDEERDRDGEHRHEHA